MSFNREAVALLLAQCHRRCCICHCFCGVKIETDHIVTSEEGGDDQIENAIPVCFNCHAEIHSYNDKHPRGRKFTSDELKAHKTQWLEICFERPEVLVDSSREVDVGPLQALIDELEFNAVVASAENSDDIGCTFQEVQFHRAIKQGSISIVKDEVKNAVVGAYRAMGSANTKILSYWQHDVTKFKKETKIAACAAIRESKPKIDEAKQELMHFLGNTSEV